MILYEYPFNERIRTYLRLEHLFGRLAEFIRRSSTLDHHFALATMFEIMDVGSRADLKSDALKDLERQRQVFNAYRGSPAIVEDVLESVLLKIETSKDTLNQQAGKFAQALLDNEWLMSIRSRINIPGGTCGFDLPAYCAWQHQPAEIRQQALASWCHAFSPLGEAITLLLQLLRNAGTAQKVIAPEAYYQQNLPANRSFQLLRLWIEPESRKVPEISANRLIISIRFHEQSAEGKLQKIKEDTGFVLALCAA